MKENIIVAVTVFSGGLLGIAGRWKHVWQQNRTTDTFTQYLLDDWGSTLQSLFTNLVSSATMFSSLPEEVSIALAVTTTYGAFMAGFGIDSRLNKFTKTESTSLENRRAD
ncbi:MAG: hypothetical protein WC241_04920 [Candidatus Paceibacterota bacterium]|jgi:hypothetical protein